MEEEQQLTGIRLSLEALTRKVRQLVRFERFFGNLLSNEDFGRMVNELRTKHETFRRDFVILYRKYSARTIKRRGLQIGIQFSTELVNGMIQLTDFDSVLAKLGDFLDSYQNVHGGITLQNIKTLLASVDEEVRKLKNANIAELSAGASYPAGRSFVDLFEMSSIEITELDAILMHPGLYDPENLSEDDVSSLTQGINRCQENLERIKMELNELTGVASLITIPCLEALKAEMARRIDDMWR